MTTSTIRNARAAGLAVLLLGCALATQAGCGHRPVNTGDDAGGSTVADAGVAADTATTVKPDAAPSPDAAAPACGYERLTSGTMLSHAAHATSVPTLAFAKSRFGVAWLRSTAVSHPEVRMRLVNLGGKALDPEKVVGPESHAWAELGASGERFGLCWHTDSGAKSRASFRTIDVAGMPQSVHNIPGEFTSCYGVQSSPAGWLVLVRGYLTGDGDGLAYRYALARLDANGKSLGAPTTVFESGSSTSIYLGQSASGVFVANIVKDASNTFDRVIVRRVESGGVGKSVAIPSGKDGNASRPKLVRMGDDLALVYGEELRGTPGQDKPPRVLYLQRLDAKGGAAGARVALTPPTQRAVWHAAVWDGATLLVASIEQHELFTSGGGPLWSSSLRLLQLDAQGARRQPDVTIATQMESTPTMSYPRIAVDPTSRRVGLAWNIVSDPEHRRGVWFALAGCK